MSLRDRIALVTGGSTGIGLGIVERLLDDGAKVAFFSQDAGKVKEAEATLAQRFAKDAMLPLVADLRDPAAIASTVEAIVARWGKVDILVNNAGISPKKTQDRPWIEEMSVEAWTDVLSVNLTGAFVAAKAVAPSMMKQGYGRIVSIGSLAGRAIPQIAGPAYAASKAGLAGMTRALARDLAPYGITVNCVAPGRILSPMAGGADTPVNQAALKRIAVGRFGNAGDVASAVAYLASEEAGFVTGLTLDVNGGEFAS